MVVLLAEFLTAVAVLSATTLCFGGNLLFSLSLGVLRGLTLGPAYANSQEQHSAWVLRVMPFKYTVHHVPSGQNIADCLSRLTKIPASTRDGATEEYVRMVAINATPCAMTTREIERASGEDEDLGEVYRCWKTGDWSTAPSPYRLLHDEITVVGRLAMRGISQLWPTV